MMNKSKRKGRFLMTLGFLLMAAALVLTCYNLWDEHRAGKEAEKVLEQLLTRLPITPNASDVPIDSEKMEIPDYILNPQMEMPTEEIDEEKYIGVLSIPALELELPIASEWSYKKLKVSPVRYKGSSYQDDLIIAAHNYRTHFGKLKNLTAGDAVNFTDTQGNVFSYVVAQIETLSMTDVSGMESGRWPLTLFTCTVGGQSRIAVRCEYALSIECHF